MGLRPKDFKQHCFRSCHTDHRGLCAETLCILSEELSRREAPRPLQCIAFTVIVSVRRRVMSPRLRGLALSMAPCMPGTTDLSPASCPAQTEKPLPTSCFVLFAGLLG